MPRYLEIQCVRTNVVPSYYYFALLCIQSKTLECLALCIRDVEAEAEAVEAVLFLWKRKREKSTASAST